MIGQNLLKKLLVNALKVLDDQYGNAGCNDLFADDPLLKGVSKKEKEKIRKAWVEAFPESEWKTLDFDFQVVELLIKSVKGAALD